jgi:hypothetical protein
MRNNSLTYQTTNIHPKPSRRSPAKSFFFTFTLNKMNSNKMSLNDVQGKLSRSEMKNVMAGTVEGCYTSGACCASVLMSSCGAVFTAPCGYKCSGGLTFIEMAKP